MIATLLATGALAVAGASTPPSDRADWEFKPSGEAVSRAYPVIATALNLEGSTIMRCAVDQFGVLHDCEVAESKAPKGLGFEAASLSLAEMFRMRPGRGAGGRGADGTVQIPLNFRLPKPTTAFPETGPPLSPDGLTLARTQIAHLSAGAELDQGFERQNKALADVFAPGVDDATRKEAMVAIRTAQAAVRAEVLEYFARVLASHLTAAQIQAGLDYGKTRGSEVVRAGGPSITGRVEAFSQERRAWLAYRLHAEFCRVHGCDASAPPGSTPALIPWIETPTRLQFDAAWPVLAKTFFVGGFADLECRSTEFGVLTDCRVTREKPGGLGFGAAALSLSSFYRRPPAIRGEISSLRIWFPMIEPPKVDPPAVPVAMSRKDDLARQVVKAEGFVTVQMRLGENWIAAVVGAPLPGASESARTEAHAVLTDEIETFVEQASFVEAAAYSEVLSEKELEERLAYVSGSDYVALRALTETMALGSNDLSQAVAARVSQEAGRIFCLKHDCPKLPPYRGPRSPADLPPPLPKP